MWIVISTRALLLRLIKGVTGWILDSDVILTSFAVLQSDLTLDPPSEGVGYMIYGVYFCRAREESLVVLTAERIFHLSTVTVVPGSSLK